MANCSLRCIVWLACLCTLSWASTNPDIKVKEGLITSRRELNAAIERGPNRKMGFLSVANFNSVHTLLNEKVVNLTFGDTKELYEAVRNGTVIAGLISGVPSDEFSVFSTDLISPRAFQMMPGDKSRDLMEAVDAAVVRTHHTGELQQAAVKNPPFQAVEVHTCRSSDPEKIPFPDKDTATGLLADVLKTRKLRVLAYGTPDDKPHWAQDGNYQVNPPEGFWPDYMTYFMKHFRQAYGDDIELERVWMKAGGSEAVLDGSIHMTEPYYIYENLYNGRVKKWSFQFSCIIMGYEQQFFAKGLSLEVVDDKKSGDSPTCKEELSTCRTSLEAGCSAGQSAKGVQVDAASPIPFTSSILGLLLPLSMTLMASQLA